MIWKTTLANKLGFNLFSIFTVIFTIVSSLQMQAQCNSNNVTVNDFYLGDENGVPLQPNSNYQIGQPVDAYLYAQFGGSSGNGYSLYLEYNISVDGVSQPLVKQCLYNGQPIPPSGYHQISSFTWEWGKELELQNLYMDWYTNSKTRICEPQNRNSQCYNSPVDLLISTPLVANFDYTQSCEDYTVNFTNLTTGGDVDNYSYHWDFGGLDSSTDPNPSYTFPGPGQYLYEVVLTSNDGSVQSTYSESITIFEPVNAQITGNEELTCEVTSITLDASSSTVQSDANYQSTGATYQWSTGATTATIEVSEPGDYWVIVTDSDNGCSDETEVSVTEDVTPVVAEISGNQELTCEMTSITLDASSSTVQGTASYEWSTGATTATIEVSEPGDYWVIVTDSDNKCSDETEVSVTEDVTPVVAQITGNEELTCEMTSITLDASSSTVQGTASYEWSTGATTATIEVSEPGDYWVTITDSDNSCLDSKTVTVIYIP
ncbi:MAG TPA: PKD domain-containing protein, partial [Salegentibacter sp.]|uniref:PKD domain-containing protein n=1 Tax=Salegentibacter sp. TaxID=1903072 RepID=UPI002F92F01E